MLAIISARDPDALRRLEQDAIREMQTWKSVTIKQLDEDVNSDCSIAGTYLGSRSPAEIGIVRTLSRRRANFTALHEFGHHLQQNTSELADQLAAQPDYGRALEEATSDLFAARVLLPLDRVQSRLGAGTPTAIQVAELYEASHASRAAVCVAAAQQLASPGFVMLIDDYGIIEFVASRLVEYPLRRGLDQGDSEIVRIRHQSDQRAVKAKTRFAFAGGGKTGQMYAQAVELSPYTLIVAVVDKAPWEALSLSSTEKQFDSRWHHCERCENAFRITSESRCGVCNSPRCPQCDWCACRTRLKEKTCVGCFLVKSIELFGDGSEVCRECAS